MFVICSTYPKAMGIDLFYRDASSDKWNRMSHSLWKAPLFNPNISSHKETSTVLMEIYKLSVVTLLLWLQEVPNISWYLTKFCILSSRCSYLCAIYVCYSLSQRKRLWEICEMTYWWNDSCNSKYWIMCITHCDILPWWIVRELVKVPSVYVIFHSNVTDVTFIYFRLTIHECS